MDSKNRTELMQANISNQNGEPAATVFPVYQVLPKGKENAVRSQQLCNVLGYDSVRELQKEIARERQNGAVILSSTEGGYYQAGNDWEIKEFVKTLESRAKNTFLALRSARRLMGQQGAADGE